MKKAFAIAAALALLCSGVVAQADVFNLGPGITSLETVTVGDPGNAADTTGYGSVDYTYNIGKYDVTAAQYCDFLNAVAATDTYGLYNASMSSYSGCGITRTGAPGAYTYSVASNSVNLPAVYVSFWDACRFANWVGNGQPTGLEGAGTTETGAYTLNADGMTYNTVTRNAGAMWCVTSENEWYKAAYYMGGGTNVGYWEYPTQSNTVTTAMANYDGRGLTPVGSYPYPSAYGTYDQGGDVWQWNDDMIDPLFRIVRGGSYYLNNGSYFESSISNMGDPSEGFPDIGFRLSEVVPEPSSLLALACGLIPLIGIRRRRA